MKLNKLKKLFQILLLILAVLPLLLLAVFLPFKQTQYLLLRINNQKNSIETKIPNYENFVEKYPSYISPRLKLASYYAKQSARLRAEEKDPEAEKYFDSALNQYNVILKTDPKNTKALSALGHIYIKQKELKKATDLFKTLVESEHNNVTYRKTLASIYYSRDMTNEALDEINEAITIDPENVNLYLKAAAIYEKMGDLPPALTAYREAVRATQKGKMTASKRLSGSVAHYMLGRFYLKMNLLFNALQEFKKSLELWPDSIDPQIELARTYYLLGMNDTAISVIMNSTFSPKKWAIYKHAYDYKISDNNKADICDILGRAFLKNKEYTDSLKYFKMAIQFGAEYRPGFVDHIDRLAKRPWKNLKKRYKIGDHVEGTIKTVADYGIIIELEKGVDGLVNISDISWTKRIRYPGDTFKEGEKNKAVILGFDEEKNRIVLGIKQLTADPWNEIKKRYAPATVHKGKIIEVRDFGLYLELEEDLEGFLRLEASRGLQSSYKTGDILTVKVIKIDDIERKIYLEEK